MEASSHDVLLVGGGGAGLRAAIAAAEVNPKLNIAVVSKVYPMRSHTVSAEGGAAGVAKPDDSLDEHAYDTISGGDWLSDQDAVEAFVKEAPQELLQLERWGCPWNREPDGHIAVRAFGGMKKRRTWFAADKTGFHMLHTLFQTTLKYEPITRYDEWFVTKLLVDDGRVQGVVAIELMSGKIQAILAQVGHPVHRRLRPRLPFHHQRQHQEWRRHGAGLSCRRSAEGHGVSAVPSDRPAVHRHSDYRSRARRGRLHAEQGRLPLPAGLQPRETGAQAGPALAWNWDRAIGCRRRSSRSISKGRTTQTPHGPVVHLDLRHLGEKLINARLPFVRELCLKYQNIDPVKELIPVRPVVHYMMGGVSTDINGATPLRGLFAAGEVACVSINGANRLGSNSLPECLVFGARAGKARRRVTHPRSGPPAQPFWPRPQDEEKRWSANSCTRPAAGNASPPFAAKCRPRGNRRRHLSRRVALWSRATAKLRDLQERYRDINLDDRSRTFNTELESALELGFMLDVAESIVHWRCIAPSRAARISVPTSRPGTTRTSWRIRWSIATRTALRGWNTLR